MGGSWNSGGGNSFVCGQNGGGGGGYNPGYNPGYNSGYNPGYNSGYNPGYNQVLSSLSSPVFPISSVQGGNAGRCGMRGGTCGDGGAASPDLVVAARPGEAEEEIVQPTIGPSE